MHLFQLPIILCHTVQVKTRRQLATLPAVSKTQIDFMFLWDQFIKSHVWPYADYKVPMACKLFAWKEREALQDIQHQRHYIKHLHALFMFKLIQQEDLDFCLSILRDPQQGERLRIQGIEQKLGYSQVLERRKKRKALQISLE